MSKRIFNPCPKCGHELEMGFGLAGGGYGAYEYCTNPDGCEQFTKWQEHDEGPALPSADLGKGEA